LMGGEDPSGRIKERVKLIKLLMMVRIFENVHQKGQNRQLHLFIPHASGMVSDQSVGNGYQNLA
jgi:hypothetical protein